MRLDNCCPNISMGMIFMNTENSKTNEPHKFILNLLQRLDLRSSNKPVALQNVKDNSITTINSNNSSNRE